MINVALPTIRDVFDVTEAESGLAGDTLLALLWDHDALLWSTRRSLRPAPSLHHRYGHLWCLFAVWPPLFRPVPFPCWCSFASARAIGSAAIPPLGTALIMRRIPSARRGASIGLIAASVGAGQAIGPSLGGGLTEFVSWRAVFLVSAVIMVLIPFQYRMFPSKPDDEPSPVDWLGGFALAATIAGLLISVNGDPATRTRFASLPHRRAGYCVCTRWRPRLCGSANCASPSSIESYSRTNALSSIR